MLPMKDAEIQRRYRHGCPVKILAELNDCSQEEIEKICKVFHKQDKPYRCLNTGKEFDTLADMMKRAGIPPELKGDVMRILKRKGEVTYNGLTYQKIYWRR